MIIKADLVEKVDDKKSSYNVFQVKIINYLDKGDITGNFGG